MNPLTTSSAGAPTAQSGTRPKAHAAARAAFALARTARARTRAAARRLATTLAAVPPPGRLARQTAAAIALAVTRIRHGRPGTLALRTLAALVLAGAALHSRAGAAPIAGTLTGIGSWLALTARGDLAPPSGR